MMQKYTVIAFARRGNDCFNIISYDDCFPTPFTPPPQYQWGMEGQQILSHFCHENGKLPFAISLMKKKTKWGVVSKTQCKVIQEISFSASAYQGVRMLMKGVQAGNPGALD